MIGVAPRHGRPAIGSVCHDGFVPIFSPAALRPSAPRPLTREQLRASVFDGVSKALRWALMMAFLQFSVILTLAVFDQAAETGVLTAIANWWMAWARSSVPLWWPWQGLFGGLAGGALFGNGLVELLVAWPLCEVLRAGYRDDVQPGVAWTMQQAPAHRPTNYTLLAAIVVAIIFANPAAWFLDGFTPPIDFNLDVARIGPVLIVAARTADLVFSRATTATE